MMFDYHPKFYRLFVLLKSPDFLTEPRDANINISYRLCISVKKNYMEEGHEEDLCRAIINNADACNDTNRRWSTTGGQPTPEPER
jgi:hypothetical protein